NPHQRAIGYPVFSPDGTRLIGAHSSGKAKGVCVWDLQLIRGHLAEMGLDWDAPPYPPAAAEYTPVRPPKIEVRTGNPARPALSREEKARQAIERWNRVIAANPDDAKACNNLAWAYLTAPEPLRDVKAAVPLAENAVRLAPNNAECANTLGAAYYRAGRYREAADVLRRNLDRQADKHLASGLHFLAMSHRRLGEAAPARDYFGCAV